MNRVGVLLTAAAVIVLGCVSGGAPVTEPPHAGTLAPTPGATLVPVPKDQATAGLVAISASHPFREAAGVFATCQVGGDSPVSIQMVAGMAKLPEVADLPHYVPLTGREPQLEEPGPVWVIRIVGDVTQRYLEIWTDPTCIVTNADFGWFATGRITDPKTGKTFEPESPALAPDRTLPPLAR